MRTKLEIEYEGVEAYVIHSGKRIARYMPNFRKALVLEVFNNDVAFELDTLKYHSEKNALKALTEAVERIASRACVDNSAASMNAALLDANW